MTLKFRHWLLPAVALYALSGFYMVGGNEKAVVRRFGRFTGVLEPSGLHYDWPYPFRTIDRLNFAAAKSIMVGGPLVTGAQSGLPITTQRAFLTGDQNLLQVRAQVLYRPREDRVADYLFAQTAPEIRLSQLAEAVLADLISRSGVDFAHVQGLAELNQRLTSRLRSAADTQHLGVEIEQAVIEMAEPPVRVKADFLDVSNARAEQVRTIQEARTWGEQRVSQAQSDRQRRLYDAEADRLSRTAAAQGAADRFRHLVTQMHQEADRTGGNYEQVRQLAMQRLSWQTLQEIWPRVRKKTIVNNDGPVDVSVFPKRDP